MRLPAAALLLALLAPSPGAAGEPDRQLDRTGVRWVLPWSAAAKAAQRSKRLLVVPVIAGGSMPSGCW